jgi:hypothetical protein
MADFTGTDNYDLHAKRFSRVAKKFRRIMTALAVISRSFSALQMGIVVGSVRTFSGSFGYIAVKSLARSGLD